MVHHHSAEAGRKGETICTSEAGSEQTLDTVKTKGKWSLYSLGEYSGRRNRGTDICAAIIWPVMIC